MASQSSIDSVALGAATLAVGQAVSLWTALCPNLTEIRRHNPGNAPDFADDVRNAELVAGSVAITVGAGMSILTRSYGPIIASSVVIAALLIAYEYTLQRPGHFATVTEIHTETGTE